jgi:T5SS/PEP-CTERM-associated repeat protein
VSAIADTKELDVGTTLDIVTGGDLLAFSWFIIAYNAVDTATVTINGGKAGTSGAGMDMTVGFRGEGFLNMTDGTITTADDLYIGREPGGVGHFTLDGALSAVSVDDLYLGESGAGDLTINGGSFGLRDDGFVGNLAGGSGVLTVSGGTLAVFDDLFLGAISGGSGELTVSGAASAVGADDLHVGEDGDGLLTFSAGSMTLKDDLLIGSNATGDGEMIMSGGALQLNELRIATRGKAVLTMNGAVGGAIAGTGLMLIGEVAGSVGKLYMESGSITVGNLAYVGLNGSGLLDMTGGEINIPADKPLVIGRNDGSSGEVLLKGGTITAGALEFTNGVQVAVLSRMDITDGTLILSGNRVGQVNGFIDAGYLTTAYGGGCLLNVAYDPGSDRTTVTAGPASNGFEVWASGFGAVGRFGADDDGDGVSNGEEWCFYGTNPSVSQGHGSPILELAVAGPGTFTLTHLRPITRDGITLSYEWTTNLQGPWYAADASDGTYTVSFSVGTPVPEIAGYEKVPVTATASPAAITRFFARLAVSTD